MNVTRAIITVFIGLVVLAPLAGETIAVSVRQRSEHEQGPLLAAQVEQGAMDHFFGAGHIVFDLDIDPNDEVYTYRAIDQALSGGAAYVVVLDMTFMTAAERELAPDTVDLAVLDVVSEDELARRAFSASDLERFAELTPQTIADRLGALAAGSALEAIAGGNAEW